MSELRRKDIKAAFGRGYNQGWIARGDEDKARIAALEAEPPACPNAQWMFGCACHGLKPKEP